VGTGSKREVTGGATTVCDRKNMGSNKRKSGGGKRKSRGWRGRDERRSRRGKRVNDRAEN
jgi:hypothetical protein